MLLEMIWWRPTMARGMNMAWMRGDGHQREGKSPVANDNHEYMACAHDTLSNIQLHERVIHDILTYTRAHLYTMGVTKTHQARISIRGIMDVRHGPHCNLLRPTHIIIYLNSYNS